MKANVLFGIGDLRYTDVAIPQLRLGEVLVRVRAAGICGSDVARVFKTGTYHFPTIIGHEFSGEVCEVADQSDKEWLGCRVAVFPLKPCFSCEHCKAGKYELCLHYDYLGSRSDGGFAEYVAVPTWNLLPISDSVSFVSAAMLEPSAVAMHALLRSGMKCGDTIAVIGPGTIGMILCKLAMIAGAENVLLIGRTPAKLDFARAYGIENTCHSEKEDVAEWIKRKTGCFGVDVAVEGTGASTSLNLCFDIVKHSGTIVAMGNPLGNMSLEKDVYWKLLRKQQTLCGTWNSSYGVGVSDWKRVLNLLERKRLNVEGLITHRYSLAHLSKGLEMMQTHSEYSNKIMIVND